MDCPSSKIPFATRAEANAELRAQQRRGAGKAAHVYACPSCGQFHIGRPAPWQRKNGQRLLTAGGSVAR